MIESFDKDLELAIDRKIVEKQHKLMVDSLKSNGVGVSLDKEINNILVDYFTGAIDMTELGNRYEKSINKDIENTFKKIYNKLPAEDGFKNRV